MHSKLSHLSEQQISELIERYYSEKATDLVKEYAIDIRPSGLVGLFPPIVHNDLFCPYCDDVNLVSKRKSKTGYGENVPFCPECKHEHKGHCWCANCRIHAENRKNKLASIKRSIIYENYRIPEIILPNVTDLSFKDAVYLLSVSRHSLSETLETIDPFNLTTPCLAPTYQLTNEIIQHLYAKGFLCIDPESDVEAFSFDEAVINTDGYYPVRVTWNFLCGISSPEKRGFLKDIETLVKSDNWPEQWIQKKEIIWYLIAKYECLEYFAYQLQQRNFKVPEFGEKTHSVFDALLSQYAISQIFNLIWQTVRDITDYTVKEGIPKYKAKNMFINALQRKADKFQAEGWDVRHSRRDFNCPQTVLSSTFFNVFMEIGQEALEARLPMLPDV